MEDWEIIHQIHLISRNRFLQISDNFHLKVNFSEILPGTYMVKIKTRNEEKTVKIIKE
ncbi:T9SS type A sorting domain-containing protein [Chryseobacterium indologenes]|nr:T9SS type A sorting domain-containing protein [Chryseobacterium indologenes]QQQ71629.1 T9SS type A sorting domain-containing protein [Chryseobacterium indologenes]